MLAGSEGLRPYFQRELRSLREQATRFAQDHPNVARELGLSKGRSRDPQVELLIQSFAWLTGRLNFRLDEDRALIPNLLLGLLYPHLQAPQPCMAVAQIQVKPDGANFADGWVLKRGRQIFTTAVTTGGGEVDCRFSAVYDTPLLPLRVAHVHLANANSFAGIERAGAKPVLSVLRARIERIGDEDIRNFDLSRLRLHIADQAYDLYELLREHCTGIAVRGGGGQPSQILSADTIRWLGYAKDEAALPFNAQTHPGFRLLQEYFAFRDKFLFFDIEGMAPVDAGGQLELLFLLDNPTSARLNIEPGSLRLNCVPLVNLYPQRMEPVRLDHRNYEYRLVGDVSRHRFCEIHTLTDLAALQADGSERELAPYFAASRYDQVVEHDYFYLARRSLSPLPGIAGTELYLSFLDLNLSLGLPPGDAIIGRALCTNRRLPEHLGPTDPLELEGAGPVDHIHLLAKPTAHRSPRVLGNEPWALLAQLSPNFLSLSEHSDALGALKRMLGMHSASDSPLNLREIDGLEELNCTPSVRPLRGKDGGWLGMARGLQLHLTVNDHAFEHGSALLFGEVLQRFFSLYAAANSFTCLRLSDGKPQGVHKQWPPMAGDRIVL